MDSRIKLRPFIEEVQYELVRTDALYVTDAGFFVGRVYEMFQTPRRALKKFVKCFSSVWKTIPNEDRGTLLRHWDVRPVIDERTPPARVIVVGTLGLGNCQAACRKSGRELWFNGGAVYFLRTISVQHLIARKLGYAMCFAHAWPQQHACAGEAACIPCEYRAYSYMAAWGFDPFHLVIPNWRGLTVAERVLRCQTGLQKSMTGIESTPMEAAERSHGTPQTHTLEEEEAYPHPVA